MVNPDKGGDSALGLTSEKQREIESKMLVEGWKKEGALIDKKIDEKSKYIGFVAGKEFVDESEIQKDQEAREEKDNLERKKEILNLKISREEQNNKVEKLIRKVEDYRGQEGVTIEEKRLLEEKVAELKRFKGALGSVDIKRPDFDVYEALNKQDDNIESLEKELKKLEQGKNQTQDKGAIGEPKAIEGRSTETKEMTPEMIKTEIEERNKEIDLLINEREELWAKAGMGKGKKRKLLKNLDTGAKITLITIKENLKELRKQVREGEDERVESLTKQTERDMRTIEELREILRQKEQEIEKLKKKGEAEADTIQVLEKEVATLREVLAVKDLGPQYIDAVETIRKQDMMLIDLERRLENLGEDLGIETKDKPGEAEQSKLTGEDIESIGDLFEGEYGKELALSLGKTVKECLKKLETEGGSEDEKKEAVKSLVESMMGEMFDRKGLEGKKREKIKSELEKLDYEKIAEVFIEGGKVDKEEEGIKKGWEYLEQLKEQEEEEIDEGLYDNPSKSKRVNARNRKSFIKSMSNFESSIKEVYNSEKIEDKQKGIEELREIYVRKINGGEYRLLDESEKNETKARELLTKIQERMAKKQDLVEKEKDLKQAQEGDIKKIAEAFGIPESSTALEAIRDAFSGKEPKEEVMDKLTEGMSEEEKKGFKEGFKKCAKVAGIGGGILLAGGGLFAGGIIAAIIAVLIKEFKGKG